MTIHAAPPGLANVTAVIFYRHVAPPALDRGSGIFGVIMILQIRDSLTFAAGL
jgi:hypothetical protein